MADLWGYEHLLNKPLIQNRSHVVDFMGSAMKEAGGAFSRYQAMQAEKAEREASRQHEKDMFGLQNDAQNERFGKEMDLKGQQFGLDNERYQSGQRAEAMKRNIAPVEATRKELDIPDAWELDQVRGKYDAALASPSIGTDGRVPYADAPGPWREGYEPNVSTSEFQTYMAPEIEAARKAYLQRTAGEKLKQTYASHPRQPASGGGSEWMGPILLKDLNDAREELAKAGNLDTMDMLALNMMSDKPMAQGLTVQGIQDQRKAEAQRRYDAALKAYESYQRGGNPYAPAMPAPRQPASPQPQAQPNPARIQQFQQRKAQLKGDPNAIAILQQEFPDLAGM